jgi:SlyX protein
VSGKSFESENDMDDALTDLQARLTYQEDDLKHLGETVMRQQRELDELRRELERLTAMVRDLAPSQVGERAEEPPPPHY